VTTQLVRLLEAAHALEGIEDAAEAVAVVRLAEAARVYARQAQLGADAENAATAIRLKAEIRLAEIVDRGQERGEIARYHDRSEAATYSELGITKDQIYRARRIAAAFSPTTIDALAEIATARGETISRSAVLREASRHAADTSEQALEDVTPGADELGRARDVSRLRAVTHELLALAPRVAPFLTDDERRTIAAQLITARRIVGGLERLEVLDGSAI